MTIDGQAFRRAMGHFATGVGVITADREGAVRAMTANAFTSVSLDPPLVLVALDRRTRMAGLLDPGTGFAVNLLREDQQALSRFFAGAWKEAARPPFRFVPFAGGPRLEGASATVGCEVDRRHDGGDHWLVVGRVLDVHVGVTPHYPLVFFRGEYRELARDHVTEAPEIELGGESAQVFYESW